MSQPRNICPICQAPFTEGSAFIEKSDDIRIHTEWHYLEMGTIPNIVVSTTHTPYLSSEHQTSKRASPRKEPK
jgi:hypothetical protein